MQSIRLCYGDPSKLDWGELLLKKPELQQVDKEGPKVQIFVPDTFYFVVLVLLGAVWAPLPWVGQVSCRIPHFIGALKWF